MVKNAVGGSVWVGMGAVFLAGFVAIFAVVFAAANVLLGAGAGRPSARSHTGQIRSRSWPRMARRAWDWPRNP